MQVALTWDLMIIIFFVIIMSYSYIVGQNGTIKIILSSYIAMLAANGLGNLFTKYVQFSQPLIKILDTGPESNGVILKIFAFIVITLILVLRGGFLVDMGRPYSLPVRLLTISVFGFLSAGLIMSTILTFLASNGGDAIFASAIQDSIQLPAQTLFVRSLIEYYNIWFAAPAIAFVLLSLVGNYAPPIIEPEENQ